MARPYSTIQAWIVAIRTVRLCASLDYTDVALRPQKSFLHVLPGRCHATSCILLAGRNTILTTFLLSVLHSAETRLDRRWLGLHLDGPDCCFDDARALFKRCFSLVLPFCNVNISGWIEGGKAFRRRLGGSVARKPFSPVFTSREQFDFEKGQNYTHRVVKRQAASTSLESSSPSAYLRWLQL